jgi:membrane fusion protein
MSNNAIQNLPLFRTELTSAMSQQWLGGIRLAQPISSWVIACAALALSAAFIAFVFLGSVTKKARITGVLVPGSGSLVINAPTAGILTKTYVVEGQQVKAGAPLFEISTERQGSGGDLTVLVAQQLNSRVRSLELERHLRTTQYQERKSALTQRLQGLTAEAGQLEYESELVKRRLALAQQNVQKYETLQASGYVSSIQAQQQQADVIELSARLSNLARSAMQLRVSRQATEGDLAALSTALATELAQLQRAQSATEQEIAENNSRKSVLITASQTGRVTTVTNQVGQAINASQTLATLIPVQAGRPEGGAALEVNLYAPSRTAGFVARGQVVLIRYHAFPYQKFGLQEGIVTDVSTTPFAPNELPQNLASTILMNAQQGAAAYNGGEALYRIRVIPKKQTIDAYGHPQFLKPGMTLEADVIQHSRKIWEWIAEPLLAMTK